MFPTSKVYHKNKFASRKSEQKVQLIELFIYLLVFLFGQVYNELHNKQEAMF